MTAKTKTKLWPAQRRQRDTNFPEKRAAVIETAANLFTTRGYENTSLSDIADKLNIHKTTIYYYVESKDEILNEIVRKAQDEIMVALDRVEASPGDTIDKIEELMGSYLRIVLSDYGRCLTTINHQRLSLENQRIYSDKVREAGRRFRRLFERAAREGALSQRDVTLLYHMSFGAMNWTAVWFKADGRYDMDEFVAEMVGCIMDGLRSREKPAGRAARGRPGSR